MKIAARSLSRHMASHEQQATISHDLEIKAASYSVLRSLYNGIYYLINERRG